MTSISNDPRLMPRTQRDTRRMNQFVSIAAAVAGLLFGLDIGVIAGALPFITRSFCIIQPIAGVGSQQHDARRGDWCALQRLALFPAWA
ncbi:Arabinose transporter [Kluyvera cryocrescens]|uniref:Arabinose transporter n=1 Tax=Kluyvera cryocrescens TaxID=580 RepID=A0A485B346_KLUCR|nr:Arabinose transporter [Kluyvera cryocrescens]